MFEFWKNKGLALFLLPFSWVYQIIIQCRYWCYLWGIFKVKSLPIPVIVVGNITVGGTGKTPLVLWLANYLKDHGFKPGIVSRGYGGKASSYPIFVREYSDPREVGDEALLLAQRSGLPVVVDPNRANAAELLFQEFQCDIILSDDGLQHYALGRDIEIAVIDGINRFGNGFCLPAGPLREPIRRIKRCDFLLTQGEPLQDEFQFTVKGKEFVSLVEPTTKRHFAEFQSSKIHAVAGIANPKRFFNHLKRLGLHFQTQQFSDHYAFSAKDFTFAQNGVILMTEKDAVKCKDFADERFYYLPIDAELPVEFATKISSLVKDFQNANL